MATPEATDSGAHQGLLGKQDEGATRTMIRVNLPEEVLQALKKRAELRGVAVTTFANYVLTRAVMED